MLSLPTGVFLLLLHVLSVSPTPVRHAQIRQLPAVQISWVTDSTTVLLESTATATDIVTVEGTGVNQNQYDVVESPFLVDPPPATVSETGLTLPISIFTATATTTMSEVATVTVYVPPTTVTVPPSTVTDLITVSQTFTATPGSFWAAPPYFTDLDSFKVSHFACGQQNLQIISGASPNVSNQNLAAALGGIGDLDSLFGQEDPVNSSSVLQLLYPANSINPGNSPQGGADFYATPLPLNEASNVTLEYSVLFPDGFDWVQGGKLPGLYGGHMTCSGGDDAASCFSTRLMWRENGAGELYLYAPKDKQTSALCHAPPESVCDAAYGLSIGRGSFYFTPGAWSHLRQTVSLNTPGEQDGGFRLEVDGKVIMDRNDVFYRDIPSLTTTSTSDIASPTGTQTSGDADADDGGAEDGGLLSPLLGGVLGPLGVSNEAILPLKDLDYPVADRPPLLPTPTPFSGAMSTDDAASALINGVTQITPTMETVTLTPTVTETAPLSTITVASYVFQDITQDSKIQALQSADNPKPVGFSGLFFSTFFGGSSSKYATPTDQYAWFRDFAIVINS